MKFPKFVNLTWYMRLLDARYDALGQKIWRSFINRIFFYSFKFLIIIQWLNGLGRRNQTDLDIFEICYFKYLSIVNHSFLEGDDHLGKGFKISYFQNNKDTILLLWWSKISNLQIWPQPWSKVLKWYELLVFYPFRPSWDHSGKNYRGRSNYPTLQDPF